MSRILIVDDSPSIRLLFVRRLEMDGHETIEAADGAGAIAAVHEPDIVLLDAMLPDMSGTEVLASLKKVRPELPVLSVSAVTGLAHEEAWALADGHLAKPIDFNDLLGQIERLTSGPPRP